MPHAAGMNLLHPRDEIMATMERIYRYRMTTTSGGNLSIREPNGDLWITPAGVDKGSLRREDIVRVRPDGSWESPHRPSSELLFHRAIYARRPDAGGIVHAHPVALVAFSICKAVPDTRVFHQARRVCGEVAFAPYELPGSEALAARIAEALGGGLHCAVLENHGVVTEGADLQEAFQRFEALEFAAKTLVKARLLGAPRTLSDEEAQRPVKAFAPLPEFDAPPATSEEKELRRQLCHFVRRGYDQRLMISTEGSFSARTGADAFLITPYRVDRRSVGLGDVVLVDGGRRARGTSPSRASRIHRAIYRRHPAIGAIVNAYTVNATAFSLTGRAVDSRTIPESYLFLRDVQTAPYGVQFGDGEALADLVAPERPIAILENDGVIVAGSGVLDAFDRLEVLESTAEALINSRAVGEVSPMDEGRIEELRRAFFRRP
jgi:L-fuculose-phosphate aldolase